MNRYDLADDEDRGLLGSLADAGRHAVRRNPALYGWSLAAVLVTGYASLNAFAFQDGTHPSALFATRVPAADANSLAAGERLSVPKVAERPVTRIVFSGDAQAPAALAPGVAQTVGAPAPAPAAPLAELQELLARLGHYQGKIDGLDGPRTRNAIEAYKNAVGLRGIELTAEELLTSARNNALVTAAIPQARPDAPAPVVAEPQPLPSATPAPVRFAPPSAEAPVASAPTADPMVMKVQAGLRAFGNTGITVDGLAGSQTKAAIREFQSLFRLEVTGEITPALVDKMTAVGLID